MTTITPHYLTVREVAARVRVSRATVQRWIGSGRLPATRLPGGTFRISSDDLHALMRPTPRDNA